MIQTGAFDYQVIHYSLDRVSIVRTAVQGRRRVAMEKAKKDGTEKNSPSSSSPIKREAPKIEAVAFRGHYSAVNREIRSGPGKWIPARGLRCVSGPGVTRY